MKWKRLFSDEQRDLMITVSLQKYFNRRFFKFYSLFTICWTLATIFWGAWVRLSLSGDGCGASWPLCHEQVFPKTPSAVIEWIHRGTSGLCVVFIFFLLILAVRVYPKNHVVRKLGMASFVLVLIEALIGAVLVLGQFVGLNTDQTRVLVLVIHSVNSLLLAGALSLCYKISFWDRFKIKKPIFYFVLFFPLLALTGHIASLAGQLFPSLSLSQALALDFLPSAHISLKIRPWHPLLAVLFLLALSLAGFSKKSLAALTLTSCFVALFGLVTLISLSPLWMKIGHLVLAYALWIFFVFSCVQEKKNKFSSSFEDKRREDSNKKI